MPWWWLLVVLTAQCFCRPRTRDLWGLSLEGHGLEVWDSKKPGESFESDALTHTV